MSLSREISPCFLFPTDTLVYSTFLTTFIQVKNNQIFFIFVLMQSSCHVAKCFTSYICACRYAFCSKLKGTLSSGFLFSRNVSLKEFQKEIGFDLILNIYLYEPTTYYILNLNCRIAKIISIVFENIFLKIKTW